MIATGKNSTSQTMNQNHETGLYVCGVCFWHTGQNCIRVFMAALSGNGRALLPGSLAHSGDLLQFRLDRLRLVRLAQRPRVVGRLHVAPTHYDTDEVVMVERHECRVFPIV